MAAEELDHQGIAEQAVHLKWISFMIQGPEGRQRFTRFYVRFLFRLARQSPEDGFGREPRGQKTPQSSDRGPDLSRANGICEVP